MSRSAIFAEAARQWREMRGEFGDVLEAAYQAAERATNACMVNAAGVREGVGSWSLMSGPWSRVEKYGSPELLEHFQRVGRPDLEAFEREWIAVRRGEML